MALEQRFRDARPPLYHAEEVIAAVILYAESRGVTWNEIAGPCRKYRTSECRELLVHAMRRWTSWSYPNIGARLGKSHSTMKQCDDNYWKPDITSRYNQRRRGTEDERHLRLAWVESKLRPTFPCKPWPHTPIFTHREATKNVHVDV